MTNEEAIGILKEKCTYRDNSRGICCNYGEDYEAFDMAIKALEQLPCDDCISRKLLSDNICEGISCNECSFNEIDGESGCLLQKRFDELPSVQPTRPTGRWIRWYEVIESADGKSTDHIPHCKCSECGTEYDPHSSQFIKYCNECGAMMRR